MILVLSDIIKAPTAGVKSIIEGPEINQIFSMNFTDEGMHTPKSQE